MIDVGVDCVGCHQLGGWSKAMCVHDERHGEPVPRGHHGNVLKQGLLEKVGGQRCVQYRYDHDTSFEGGREVALPHLGRNAGALEYGHWVDPVHVLANRCLLGGASLDFGCVGPLGRGEAY